MVFQEPRSTVNANLSPPSGPMPDVVLVLFIRSRQPVEAPLVHDQLALVNYVVGAREDMCSHMHRYYSRKEIDKVPQLLDIDIPSHNKHPTKREISSTTAAAVIP